METPELSSLQTRQKRILPARSRRGGPGIGNCDVDLMILDTIKRKFENEPIVPATTILRLTTDSSLCPSGSPSSSNGVVYASERYFDRPDVIKAYRTQGLIQTPTFINLTEVPHVGSRFRPRDVDDNQPDTSDAAYEKRHRKYETFEKRQRLREKEKLQHEQYKLKERIEQLRGMDGSAFLSLPATAFTPEPITTNEIACSSQMNGASPSQNEGDRRRDIILKIAESIEQRYRVLLPPQKIRKLEHHQQREAPETPEPSEEEPQIDNEEEEEEEEEEAEDEKEMIVSSPPKPKLMIKVSVSRHSKSLAPSCSPKFPDRSKSISVSRSKPARRKPGRPPKRRIIEPSEDSNPDEILPSVSYPGVPEMPEQKYSPALRHRTLSVPYDGASDTDNHTCTSTAPEAEHDEDMDMGVTAPQSDELSFSQSISTRRPRRPRHVECVLITAAKRKANSSSRNSDGRHTRAFGTVVPKIVDELMVYELPYWVVKDVKGEDYFDVAKPIVDAQIPPIVTLDTPVAHEEQAQAEEPPDVELGLEPEPEPEPEVDQLDEVVS